MGLKVCGFCGEDAILVQLPDSGEWFARVRRTSKCRRRHGICKTDLFPTKDEAENAWNLLNCVE